MRARFAGFTLIVVLAAACSQPLSPTQSAPLVTTGQTMATTASGSAVPFEGRIEGTYEGVGFPPVITVHLDASGEASHLGRFTLTSVHDVNFDTFEGQGTATLVAANGDSLFCDTSGKASLLPPGFLIVETCEITGGTGRFADARGGFTLERVTVPITQDRGTTTGEFSGTLSIPHGNH